MLAAGFRLPKKNILVSLGGEENKVKLLPSLKKLQEMKFKFYATEHTADFLKENGIKAQKVFKMHVKKKPNVGELLNSGELDLIINIQSRALRPQQDGFAVRRKAIDMNIPLITNRQLAEAFIMALDETCPGGVCENLSAKSWKEYRSG
jgi:carbamoyl-phosphate synthase large subunit